MNTKSDSSSANPGDASSEAPITQADEILKQFHPELFHKRKLAAGKGAKNSSQGAANTATAPKKNVKVAHIHESAPKKFRNSRMFSFGDLMYSFTSGLSDLLNGIANLVPRTFIRAMVNKYTAIALAILIPCGTYFYIWYHTPPFFYTEHCQKRFGEIHTEFLNNRSEGISDTEWGTFIAATEDEMEEMIYNLENTSDVTSQERQLIMWAGRDNLLAMIKKKGVATQKEEEAYKRFYAKLKDLAYYNSEERKKRIEQYGGR